MEGHMSESTNVCFDVFKVDQCEDSSCDMRNQVPGKYRHYDRRPGETPRCSLHKVMGDVYALMENYKEEGGAILGEKIHEMSEDEMEFGFRAAVMALALSKELPEIKSPVVKR